MIKPKMRVDDVIYDPEYQYYDNYLYCGDVFLREKDVLSWIVVDSTIVGRAYRRISVMPSKREARKLLANIDAGKEAVNDTLTSAMNYVIDHYNLR